MKSQKDYMTSPMSYNDIKEKHFQTNLQLKQTNGQTNGHNSSLSLTFLAWC